MRRDKIQKFQPLLGSTDLPPFQLGGNHGSAKCLVVADHAGNAVPASLQRLGLAPGVLNTHIAVDIGTRATATLLASRLRAPLILANYSRLVVDLNRNLNDSTAFIDESDGIAISGNQNISAVEKKRRCNAIYQPYHNAIDCIINGFLNRGTVPVIISIHSFTPELENRHRPWHIGVLWDKDPRIALPLLTTLRKNPDLNVGDNKPYSGRHSPDYTIDHHAEDNKLAYVSIEIRQDLISNETGVEHWVAILCDALYRILDDESIYKYLNKMSTAL